MVFRFDYGEHSSLFTADIYTATETKLRGMYTNGELDADLMKVPHHGLALSSSSLAFLQAVTPEIAVATGSFDISATVAGRFDAVGTTLLEDRFHGYIHISSGRDGVMTTETE
jgi:beta-lactamase superfamily II metal-dependent hydrolase